MLPFLIFDACQIRYKSLMYDERCINSCISFAASSVAVPIVCSIMGFLGLLCIVFMVAWHNRQQRRPPYHHETQPLEQKTNNENEENIRRYRNPLFDTDRGGGTVKSTCNTELIEIQLDIEKYEKSPRRSPGSSESNNDSKQNKCSSKTVKPKNINIEIEQRSQAVADREAIV